MGLDFNNCDAHWAYSGFMRFREKLSEEIGVVLHCMEGFAVSMRLSGFKAYEYVKVFGVVEGKEVGLPEYSQYVGYQKVISWDKVKDDIKLLINHCDCEGILTPEECEKVAPRLRELVSEWPDDDRDKKNALLLAEGMEDAAANNENLEFC